MGRKKIVIRPIQDERSRLATFAKRKHGLIKKALELSILCDCEIGLVIFSPQGKLIQYSSGDIDQTLSRFIDEKPQEAYANEHLSNFLRNDGRDSGDEQPLQITNVDPTEQFGSDPVAETSSRPPVQLPSGHTDPAENIHVLREWLLQHPRAAYATDGLIRGPGAEMDRIRLERQPSMIPNDIELVVPLRLCKCLSDTMIEATCVAHGLAYPCDCCDDESFRHSLLDLLVEYLQSSEFLKEKEEFERLWGKLPTLSFSEEHKAAVRQMLADERCYYWTQGRSLMRCPGCGSNAYVYDEAHGAVNIETIEFPPGQPALIDDPREDSYLIQLYAIGLIGMKLPDLTYFAQLISR